MLNPTELAWIGLKRRVRDNNTNFRLCDVRKLTQQWMASLDVSTVISYHEHVRKIESTYKISNDFVQSIEEQIIDDDVDTDLDIEELND